MNAVANILKKQHLSKKDILRLLSATGKEEMEYLRKGLEKTTLQYIGKEIYLRGLIEFSNICHCDCYYCGIRKSNKRIKRYILKKEDRLTFRVLPEYITKKKNAHNYLYYHIEKPNGVLKQYGLIRVNQSDAYYLRNSEVAAGETIKVHYKGYTAHYQVK